MTPDHHRRIKHKNVILFLAGIAAAVILSRLGIFQTFLLGLKEYSHLGSLIGGLLFVSMSTMATGTLVLKSLAETNPIWAVALMAGIGAMLNDLIIFVFVKDSIAKEVENLEKKFAGRHLYHLLHTKYFRWTLPVIGCLIIASPLPDELGVSLIGLSRLRLIYFLPVSFVLNSIGIFTLISAGLIIS